MIIRLATLARHADLIALLLALFLMLALISQSPQGIDEMWQQPAPATLTAARLA